MRILGDLWSNILGKTEQYVKTSREKVGRLERTNGDNVIISFGSFDIENKWVVKYTVTLNKNDISYISKEEMIAELNKIMRNG